MAIELKKTFKAAAMIGAAFIFLRANSDSPVQKTIREAEALSLSKDRAAATSVLWRALKKTTNKDDARNLKDKLVQLSRYFYTDKGFENYLAGKELFEKQRYADALDKLTDAEELEDDNVDVLHYLILTQLWLKKGALAEASAHKALALCPVDLELLRDSLAAQREQALWPEAIKTAETLVREYGDTSAQTEKDWGLALSKSADKAASARKHFDAAIERDPKFPESYFWLAELLQTATKPDPVEKAQAVKLLTKYAELCENNTKAPYPREPAYCTHLSEAKKRITP